MNNRNPRILMGGIPLGCDNVGDEAIIECAVNIVRAACPEAAITVCTADEEATARKLRVAAQPLLGWPPHTDEAALAGIFREHDCFIWCGATGLSDYPEIPAGLMRLAREAGLKTIIWGVGMNDELNPALYRLHAGRKLRALSAIRALTLGAIDAVAPWERRLDARARAAIARTVNAADLVVVRDPETKHELERSGVTRDIVVGADSALLMEPPPLEQSALPADVRALLSGNTKPVGICVSAQREMRERSRFVEYLDWITGDLGRPILFLPMNPVTDANLMRQWRAEMRHADRSLVLEGRYEPADVMTAITSCGLMVSSRLHALILASIRHVPILGISRGSKVDSFLRPFGLSSVGTTESWDDNALRNETRRLLDEPEGFVTRSHEVRQELLKRLDAARAALAEELAR